MASHLGLRDKSWFAIRRDSPLVNLMETEARLKDDEGAFQINEGDTNPTFSPKFGSPV